MDARTNGHGDDAPESERPRLRADGPAARPSSADSLRAVDQLARLEARIRDFHRNLNSLDAAEVDVDRLSASTVRDADAAENLVSRAADAARLAVSGGAATAAEDTTREDPGAAGRQNGSAQPPAVTTAGGGGAGTTNPAYTGRERRRRTDARPDGPFSAQRRIDALAPRASRAGGRETPAEAPSAAREVADQIRQEAERQAERLRRDAAREAAQIRHDAEQEMQQLWEALDAEVEAIQSEISQRVDGLAERMDAVSRESEEIRSRANEDAEEIRLAALEAANQVRAEAAEDAEGLLALAEREAHALIAEARAQAEELITRARSQAEVDQTWAVDVEADPGAGAADRNAAERIAEQIRDATAALTRRVSRGDDPPARHHAREIRGAAAVPNSIREVLDGLGAAVTLIERSLAGLAELLGETLSPERPDDR